MLSWYGEGGDRYLSEAEAEQQRAEQLAERQRQLGEDVQQDRAIAPSFTPSP